MNTVLVTGAGGFIGSHLVEALVARGAEVRAFVRYEPGNSWGWLDHVDEEVQERVEVITGDVRDPHVVHSAMDGCDTVFHLAALIGIPYSYRSPDTYVGTNVTGTLNVLQAARALDVDKVVHTSTSEVYGTAQFVPMTEEHPLRAQSPYAASKIGADQMAESFHAYFDLPVATARPFNTYGPRQSARAVIPTIATQIADGRRTLELGALHPTRDFSFVRDTVEGVIAVAASPQTVGEVVNIGSGHEISIGALAHLIADVMGTDVDIETAEERLRPEDSEVDRLLADTTKIQELTDWAPPADGREGLRRGLEVTARWFAQPEHLSHYKVGEYSV
jgi:dTDP-glucose 4,6-dehydratase